jgi:dimethylglycine dehydrogenase
LFRILWLTKKLYLSRVLEPMLEKRLFRQLLQAGKRFDAGFYGTFAMNSMRLEKAYRAWGADLTTERTPLEAGLGYLVKAQQREFIGKEAMLQRQRSEDHWSMQLLEFEDPEFDPFYLHTVYRDNEAIGMVTSGAYGYRLQKAIGLVYFRQLVSADDELCVDILGRKSTARIINPL